MSNKRKQKSQTNRKIQVLKHISNSLRYAFLISIVIQAIWFNVTFLYIGLASVSITINLLIANITLQYRRHKEKIKIVKKLEEELDDSDNDEDDGNVNNDNDDYVTSSQRPKHNNSDDVTEMLSLEQNRKPQWNNNTSIKMKAPANNKNAFEDKESLQKENEKLYNKERKYKGL